MQLNEGYLQKIPTMLEFFFLFYIILQPFLDLVSYFGTSISTLVRAIVIVIGFVYLLSYPKKKIKWITIIYILLLGVFMTLHILNNYMVKAPYHLMQELTYAVKSAYVVEMLIVYALLFISISKKWDWQRIVQRNIFINMLVIGVVMLLATLTGTGKLSYNTYENWTNLPTEGHSGWFYSANDLGAIFAIGFTGMIIYMMNQKSTKLKWFLIPLLLLIIWAMLEVGTKVGLGAAILVLAIGAIISFVYAIIKRETWTNLFIAIIGLVFVFAYLPYSPVGKNINISYYKEVEKESIDPINEIEEPNEIEQPEFEFDTEDLPKRLLSGRDRFLANVKEDWNEAPVSQKLFGLGPGGNYQESIKIIEIDYFDWYYSYGLLGSILLFLPLFYFAFKILHSLIRFKFKQTSPTLLMVGVSVCLSLGIAGFAGHILLNPASGIYFAIFYAYLLKLSAYPEKEYRF
ncbi:O-antigen ligase family protein [Robertmurraya massiliosenegalensis]|uniref:O-antigen ligase family protein n=1 Tax=Robertmurraya massiliosenegalensis TaxID=1287657 RepID=UPI0002FD6CB1|nr:O-antigen ligase family protein [Robertmurraya massiliosenegalensis]